MRARVAEVLLFLCAAVVTTGFALYSLPAGLIAGGVLLAAWTVLVVMEVK